MSRMRTIVVLLLLGLTGTVAHAVRAHGSKLQVRLTALPFQLSTWTGHDGPPLDNDTERLLAADAYLDRSYAGATGTPVDLYIAYYSRQQPGASIHSPLHCLPGTGWEPIEITTIPVTQPGGAAGDVRRMLVRKNGDRAIVLYWYAVHGRMLASETFSKLWLLHDSLTSGRSDAALVRIVVPVDGAAVEAAQHEGLAFANEVLPYLPQLWS
jgi:EpsI family protein